jgi:adenosylcobinamide kinase/adenosylcobinamide-phosphate guanylyltransferase
MNKVQLIIGGARSGKSALAERYATSSNLPVTYIATAQAFDHEMQQRISQHQADRPVHWQLIESPLLLAQAIELAISQAIVAEQSSADGNSSKGICILVDCLTLWLSNCLCKRSVDTDPTSDGDLAYWLQEKQQFLALLTRIQHQENSQVQSDIEIILVSNEVGHGIVPMGALSRHFVDQAGWLHQAIASIADNVEFVMAGLPLTLKSSNKVMNKAKL